MAEGGHRKLSRTDSCDSFFSIDVGGTLDDIYKSMVMDNEQSEDSNDCGAYGNLGYCSSDSDEEVCKVSGFRVDGMGCTSTPVTSKQITRGRPSVGLQSTSAFVNTEGPKRAATLQHVERKYGQSSSIDVKSESSSSDDEEDEDDDDDEDDDEDDDDDEDEDDDDDENDEEPSEEDENEDSPYSAENETGACVDGVTMTTTLCCSDTMTSSSLSRLPCDNEEVRETQSAECKVTVDEASHVHVTQHTSDGNQHHDDNNTATTSPTPTTTTTTITTTIDTDTTIKETTATAKTSTTVDTGTTTKATTTRTTTVEQTNSGLIEATSHPLDNGKRVSFSNHQNHSSKPALLQNGVNKSATDHIVYIEYDTKSEEETVLVIQGSKGLGSNDVKSAGAFEVGSDMAAVDDTSSKADKQDGRHQTEGLMTLCLLLNQNKTRQCLLSVMVFFMFLTGAAFIMSVIAVTTHSHCRCAPNNNDASHLVSSKTQGCPAGWRAYEGSCYGSVSRLKMNFTEARGLCNELGADVMSIDTRKEKEFIRRYFLEPKWRYLNRDDPVYAGDLNTTTSSFSETIALFNGLGTDSSCVQVMRNEVLSRVDCSTKLNFYCEQQLIT